VNINTLVATKVVTLIFNFELGSIAANQCGYSAQLLTGQASSP
jgi:hypothetical protein